MFFAAEPHPMMLVYLNQNRSRGTIRPLRKRRPEQPGLNETLRREAMELPTIDVGANGCAEARPNC